MREIKFRGLERRSGTWYYGGYYKAPNTGNTFIVERMTIFNEVNPNTVGQFTGAYDTDGKEIYEGDVIEAVYPSGDKVTALISFIDSVCSFALEPPLETSSKTTAMQLRPFRSSHFYKVIGNIHDNPELLEKNDE